jgi:polyisoprenoid-binding protein YceI
MKKTLILAAALAAAGAVQAQSASYAIDGSHTFVTFEVKHFNFGFSTSRGRFDKKEGSITLDPAAKTGKVDVTIDTTSINTGVAASRQAPQERRFLRRREASDAPASRAASSCSTVPR